MAFDWIGVVFLKLFCIPYAGGSSLFYYQWIKYLDKRIELIPIELAGRGRRINESGYPSFNDMVEDIYRLMHPHIKDGSPFSIFGHSMGGGIIYELTERIALYNVKHLFISGCKPPDLKRNELELRYETDEELIQTLLKLGGTPRELIRDSDFIETFFPIIRSDLGNLCTHSFRRKKITIPATILHGTMENYSIEDVLIWKDYFSDEPRLELFEGGHFFIEKFKREVTQLVNRILFETPFAFESVAGRLNKSNE